MECPHHTKGRSPSRKTRSKLTKVVNHQLTVAELLLGLQEVANLSRDGLGEMVDVLGLDDGLEVILENLCEVVLKLGSTEVLQNILPVGDVIEAAQVGLELSCKDLECSRLSDTVGSDQSKNLSRSGDGQTMELERVGRVTVSHLLLQVGGQVDNVDSTEGAALNTDTTTNAKIFRNECDLGCRRDFNTHLAYIQKPENRIRIATFSGKGHVRVSKEGRIVVVMVGLS